MKGPVCIPRSSSRVLSNPPTLCTLTACSCVQICSFRKMRRRLEISIHMIDYTIHVHTRESGCNPYSVTQQTGRPQYDHPAASVIAPHYSSAAFISLPFHSRKEKFGARFKNVISISALQVPRSNCVIRRVSAIRDTRL